MKKKILFLFFVMTVASNLFGQNVTPKEVFDLYKKENFEELKKISTALAGKPETPVDLYIKALLAGDGEKSITLLETLLARYPRSEFAVAAYAGLYLYYIATENFRKANNCVFAVENEFPGSDFDYFLDDSSPDETGE
ncbi:MAG: hypothetical protein LCH52_15785 [Bacteroidetes bacterium]|nr:hypothetical protein [Bacteroidota bacterium]